jgi:DNA primase
MPKTKYVDFKALKNAISMLQIIDHYGLTETFKRTGDSLSGPCPLHNGENSSQFRVSVSKNCWNCFGQCKRGGNVLDFVARKDGVSIREAAMRISDWFNLTFDAPNGHSTQSGFKRDAKNVPAKDADSKPETKNEAKEEAGPNRVLGFELQNLDPTHDYLAERGLSNETIAEFGLGFCTKGSMAGRVVIPIHNPDGDIVAYAGRWPGVPPKETPKYKLPAGFRKSQELFNLHRATQASPQDPLVIVEGFFDCIKLWEHGLKRVVALMGSTLSSEQEELIRKNTDFWTRVLVMLDEDEAGRLSRDQIVMRLAKFRFVSKYIFDAEGDQPETLNAKEVTALIGGAR